MDNKQLFDELKIKLNITWEDDDIDDRIFSVINDAKKTMDHKLGFEIDYSIAGQEHNLFLNYCMYSWNNCVNEFDNNYRKEIYQIRNIYKVKNHIEKQ